MDFVKPFTSSIVLTVDVDPWKERELQSNYRLGSMYGSIEIRSFKKVSTTIGGLEDFAYVVNSDVRGGRYYIRPPLRPRPTPIYGSIKKGWMRCCVMVS